MNDHNLDDLIIDTIEPENNKAKNFLTIVALVIVVLIVGILFVRTMQGDTKNTNIGLEENMSEMISPELTLQNTPEPAASKEEPKLSSMIEEELNPQTKKAATPEKRTVADKPAAQKNHPAEAAPSSPQKAVELPPVARKKEEPKRALPPTHTEKIVVPHKPYHPKETAKPIARPEPMPPKRVYHPAAKESYYIQVGSFSQQPSRRFLGTIRKHGFHYQIAPSPANGTKKLLIGPYPSRADADRALVRVRDRINKGAFIVKK